MTDYLPPPLPPPDQMEIIQTHWGPMERWRAVAMCIGEVSNAISRADDAAHASGLGPDDKPPPLAADDEEQSPKPVLIPPEVLAAIEQKIDELTARLDAFERMQKANAALDDLEAEMERLYPPSARDVELLN
jgi:hypothetical protein